MGRTIDEQIPLRGKEIGGQIKKLELFNFKSYKGTHEIGPFLDFTAIIGPNGCGKSNLMDAISFVLGVKTDALRGTLKDLIFSEGISADTSQQILQAHVKLFFEDKNSQLLVFERQIQADGHGSESSCKSVFRINKQQYKQDAYISRLYELGIMVKARNFLVFQGNIEHVATMNPSQRSQFLEQVSGSEVYKNEYDSLKEEVQKAQEEVQYISIKLRQFQNEKKAKREQKVQTEKHIALTNELSEVKLSYYLWRLYVLYNKTEAQNALITEKLQEKEETQRNRDQAGAELAQVKHTQAQIQKEKLKVDKTIHKYRQQCDRQAPAILKVNEEIEHTSKNISKVKADIEKHSKRATQDAKQLDKLEKQLEELKQNEQEAEQEQQEGFQAGNIQMTKEQMDEYNKIKNKIGKETAHLKQQERTIAQQIKADEGVVKSNTNKIAAIEAQLKAYDEQLANTKEIVKTGREKTSGNKAELAQLQKERSKFTQSIRTSSVRRDNIEKKLQDMEEQIYQAKADRRESEKEKNTRKYARELKERFQGVYGRVMELTSIREQKYRVAMTCIMYQNMDAIVVQNAQVAEQCIAHTKASKKPPMTFLPLEELVARAPNEQLREMGGSIKLAIDLLEFDQQYEKAFFHCCGDTLVCDSMDVARQVAFGNVDGRRHRVVTVGGELIAKAGSMTGGKTQNMMKKSQQWDDKELEGKEKQAAKLRDDLSKLGGGHEQSSELRNIEQRMQNIERESEQISSEVRSAEIDTLTRNKSKYEPDLAAAQQRLQQKQDEAHQLTEQIASVSSRSFAQFSKAVGVDDIEQYEAQGVAMWEAAQKKLLEIRKNIYNVENQISSIKKSLNSKGSSKAEKAHQSLLEDLAQSQTQLQQLNQQKEEYQKLIQDEEAKRSDIQQKLDDTNLQAFKIQKLQSEQADSIAKTKRALGQLQLKLDDMLNSWRSCIEAAAADGVHLPYTGDQHVELTEAEQADNMANIHSVDFSSLPPEYKRQMDDGDFVDMTDEFKENIQEVNTRLAAITPNMKALKQYEEMERRDAEMTLELKDAKGKVVQLEYRFRNVQRKRLDLFLDCLHHLQEVIDPIYKELTRNHLNPQGGSSSLTAKEPDEPYLDGINFTAMPPNKSFLFIERLSGGEKIVAALALLFAIHSFRPSPFFVLDEVDCALDSVNVTRVVDYVTKHTRPGAPGKFQAVVISLKPSFFDQADSLVGVTREGADRCSATLSLDLRQYERDDTGQKDQMET